MKWSLKLGRFAGIDVFVHWTFLILLGWIFFSQLGADGNVDAALRSVAFILAIFGCVVLHEFGHALAARRYGIGTRDITLLPIGGVARLQRMPEKPRQELVVALAGPAVNAVIAIVIFAGLLLFRGTPVALEAELQHGDFWTRLMTVNVFLGAFNLLPAFPMDGGRVLRALLAANLGQRRATQIAANIGQVLAIVLGAAGFFLTRNPFLILIAVFVYLGAQAEAQMVELTSLFRGLTVRDAMQTRFRTLASDAPLAAAVEELLAGAQHDFPVVEGSAVVGILRRQDLVKALAEHGKTGTVASAMTRECPTVEADERLDRAFERLQSGGCTAVPVMERGQLTGVLTMENISELAMVNTALEKSSAAAR
ncbi:MAG: site-2 protease family protein [Opitutaceae bacterium]|nr:site-2 protease family protein [Opitutaceae bacterium]